MAEATALVSESTCAMCGGVATTMCSSCKSEKYCGRDCQLQHWKAHKTLCKSIVKKAATTASTRGGRSAAVSSRTPSADVPALCGRGYRHWLSEHGLPRSGPQAVKSPSVGLQNQANTCYLNAVLQCMLHTPMLRLGLQKAYPKPRPEDEWLVEFINFFREVDEASGTRSTVSASSIAGLITTHKEFAKGQQADAHEAFMLIVSRLLEGCVAVGDGTGRHLSKNEYAAKEHLERSSLVGHVFGMDLGQTVKCDYCSYCSRSARVEYCLCLNCTLGMSEHELQALQRESEQRERLHSLRRSSSYGEVGLGAPKDTSAPDTMLEELLREYTKIEHIDGYRCEKCSRTGCTRTAYLARRPNVLIVYIDRRQGTGLFGKINRRVRFSKRLDLTPFVCSEALADGAGNNASNIFQYSLSAVIVHKDVNRSTEFGHYVAYVRDKTSQWHLLDDSRVEEVSWSAVQEQHAYLLLYSADCVLMPEEELAPNEPHKACPEVQHLASGSSNGYSSSRSTATSAATSLPDSSASSVTSSTTAVVSTAATSDATAPAPKPAPGRVATASPAEDMTPAAATVASPPRAAPGTALLVATTSALASAVTIEEESRDPSGEDRASPGPGPAGKSLEESASDRHHPAAVVDSRPLSVSLEPIWQPPSDGGLFDFNDLDEKEYGGEVWSSGDEE